MSKLPGLEMVRALAALTVIGGHIVYFDLVPVPTPLKMISAFGTEAVIVFFALSGLVITRSVLRTSPTPVRFIWHRLVRIYPIYIFAIGLAALTAWLVAGTMQAPSVWIGNLFFLQTLGGFIVPAPSTNPPLWSLSYEMMYYAIFAACLWRPSILGIFWCLASSSAIIASLYTPVGILGHWVGTLSLGLPWLFGNAIARFPARFPTISVPLGVCLLVIGLIFSRSPLSGSFYDPFRLCAFGLLCCPLLLALSSSQKECVPMNVLIRPIAFVFGEILLWTISPALFITKAGLTVAGLAATIMPLKAVDTVLRHMRVLQRPLVYVGSISYALYTIHVPILLLIRHFTPEIAALRLMIFFPSIIIIAHILERRIQPLWVPDRKCPLSHVKSFESAQTP